MWLSANACVVLGILAVESDYTNQSHIDANRKINIWCSSYTNSRYTSIRHVAKVKSPNGVKIAFCCEINKIATIDVV